MTLLSFPPTMADLELFRQHYTVLTGNAALYKRWKKANPGEAASYEAYAKSVLAGSPGAPPAVETSTGKALVLAARMGANG